MTARDSRRGRALALQERLLSIEPPLPDRPTTLLAQMRNALLAASDEKVLATGPGEIPKLLKMSPPSDGKVQIVGGVKDLARNRNLPRFHRKDGAWFHFTLTVAERAKQPLDLVSYDFELCFPESSKPDFVRFDLNPPGHDNEDEGLRSHVHPGTDDFSAPAPFMSPLEILDVLLYDLRLKRPKARA